MYVGRIVIVGRTNGKSWAGYRVSSRSFPNRRAEVRERSILVAPLDPKDLAKNPYIA
jgi:IMP cyclohydrolase